MNAFLVVLAIVSADPKDVDSEFARQITHIEGKLQDQFKKIIGETVMQGRFADAEQMLAERSRFLADREPPASPELKTMVSAYIAKRKEIMVTLRTSYMALIDIATKDGDRERVFELRANLRTFELRESFAVAAKKPIPKPKEATIAEEVSATEKFLVDFRQRMEDELKDIERLETQLKKVEAHKELIASADSELQGKKLTVLFPVENVVERGGGFFIAFGMPDTMDRISKDNHHSFNYTGCLGGLPHAQISKKDAIELTKGDSVAISGKCRFMVSMIGAPRGSLIPLIQIDRGQGMTSYEIFCDGAAKRIVKSTGAIINIK